MNYSVDPGFEFKQLVDDSKPTWSLFPSNDDDLDNRGGIVPFEVRAVSLNDDGQDEIIKKTRKDDADDADEEKSLLDKATERKNERQRQGRGAKTKEEKKRMISIKPRRAKSFIETVRGGADAEAKDEQKCRHWVSTDQSLKQWHDKVEKYRDDYKSKRKAAVKKSKRLNVIGAASRA